MTTETALPPLANRPPARSRASYRRRRTVGSILKHAGLITLSLVMIYPLLWLVVSSFKPNDQIFRDLSLFTTDLTIENYVTGGSIPTQFISAVERGIRNALQAGVLAGYPLVDVHVQLLEGDAHAEDSNDMAFQIAAAEARRAAHRAQHH